MSRRFETNSERIESLERQWRKSNAELESLRSSSASTDGETFEVLSTLQSGTIKVVRAELSQRFERELNQAKSNLESLLEYARHGPNCPMPANSCGCGLKELLEKIKPPV